MTRSEWGTATLSCSVGCENIPIAVSAIGLQLIVSCFSKWEAVGEWIGRGEDATMMGQGVAGAASLGVEQQEIFTSTSPSCEFRSERKASVQHAHVPVWLTRACWLGLVGR